ncbi:MAG: DUF4159 domain-containing protein [bacterium]|nr:DUF4159 domain-containing protein [bacterium]
MNKLRRWLPVGGAVTLLLTQMWLCYAQVPRPTPKQIEAQPGEFVIAQLKYSGGGDWYANPSALPNLLAFAKSKANLACAERAATVMLDSPDLWRYRYLYITGHGNIALTTEEARNLRDWLEAGGFLHADDNYGLDGSFRREMKKVFPEQDLKEVPADHPIYQKPFRFADGRPPKIHEHDGKPAQGFGWWIDGRLAVYYTYQCDLGDGWEDPDVHHDPEPVRQAALQMGTNLLVYALTN